VSPLDGLDLAGVHWVIVGGESGPGARPMREDWAVGIRDQCLAAGVPWGGVQKKKEKPAPPRHSRTDSP
jgi:protein gp37